MPDENIEELTTEQDDDSSVIRQLRGTLKDMHNKNKNTDSSVEELQGQLNKMKQDNLLLSAGVSGLSELQEEVLRQQLAKKEDADVEVVKSIVEELGFKVGNGTSDSNGEGKTEEAVTEEPKVTSALDALAIMEKANKSARTGGPAVKDFNKKMREAKSKEELRALIQNEGPQNGLIHEFDTI